MTKTEIARQKLRDAYEYFVNSFGLLNKSRNRNLINKDAHGLLICSSLEKRIHSEYEPADVIYRSIKHVEDVFTTTVCSEALVYVLGKIGRVSIGQIAEITGKEEEDVILELGDLVFVDPATNKWVTADAWLSGNVYEKLQTAVRVHNERPEDKQVARSLTVIRENQPEPVPFELLDIQLGERWVPMEYYKAFMAWFFNASDVVLEYFPSVDEYQIDFRFGHWSNTVSYSEYVVRSLGRTTTYGHELMKHAMENTTPIYTYGSEGSTMKDNDAIQLAADKIDSMRKKWQEWLWNMDDTNKDRIAERYNNLYNCFVLRQFDGSHQTFPGLDLSKLGKDKTPITLYATQKNAIWRLIQNQGGIIDHEVGLGKTLLAIITSYEMKRLGLRNKPAILCLKANVAEVASTYRTAYPSAKILAPDEKDFEPANRKRLFHEIKNNDWDCIILSHDQFGKIQQSLEIQKEVLSEELEDLEKDLNQARNSGFAISKKMSKGLENRKKTLAVKLKTAMDKIGKVKDEDITFREMGIDHLLVDEAHMYKNLTFTTRHDRVAGLGNQEGSQKALNMLFAIRELQKMFDADIQATFLSGTPISNSLTEMYLLFKYLRPRALARQNITNFDSWAAVYAKKTTDYEFSVTNQIIPKDRFRHFIKVPELALFYNEIADYKTKKMAGIDEPEMIEQLVPLTPTPDQQDYIHRLIKFAETGDGEWIFREPLSESEMSAKMLIATNCAKKMSTDMRLIDQFRYEDHPDSKLHVCATKVAEFYYRFMAQKGTQIIFCDVGTPNNDKIEVESFNSIEIVTVKKFNVYDTMRDKLVDEFGLKRDEIVFIHDYQTDKKKHELFRRVNSGEVRVLLGSTDKAGTGLNVQQRVVAMHHLDIPWKPSQLTQRNGRGVRPGNWLAKQAQDNKVYVFVYAVERSLDTYKFTLLKNKQTFISQMKNNELQTRSIDEGSIDESSGMNFAEYIAVLSGDNSLLEKAKADKKVALLENLRNVHYKEQHNNKHMLAAKTDRKVVVDQLVKELTRDVELYQSVLERDPETGGRINKLLLYDAVDLINQRNGAELRMQIEKQEKKLLRSLKMKIAKIEDDEEKEDVELKDVSQIQGEVLIDLFRNWRPAVGTYRQKIGEIYGFDVWIERVEAGSSITDDYRYAAAQGTNMLSHNKVYAQHPEGTIKYHHNHGSVLMENSKAAARNLLLAIDKSEGLLYNTYQKEQEKLELEISHLNRLEHKPFEREEELQQLKDEVKRLSEQIKQSLQKPKEEPVAA
jgi:N12 class adenine-specific DNA methylase